MISNNNAIEVKNVSKKYYFGEKNQSYFLRDEITAFFKNVFQKTKRIKSEEFYSLKDVSFEIKFGEAVGIIGPNGAGKSTILKILSRITYPSSGEVVLRGRVASLLEVGTGFNPELTGRENIFLNGAILGMTKSEIGSKFDEIVEFAEIGNFLDTPVKRYSSGMYIRLAFSIAAYLEPEILLIDEVLAVGDAKFQRKSIGKMDQVTSNKKRTIIFVSHDLGAIKKICKRCILIDKGRIIKIGPTDSVINTYLERIDKDIDRNDSVIKTTNRTGTGKVRIVSVKIENKNKRKIGYAISGETLRFVFKYKSVGDFSKVNLSFSIHTQLSQNIILHQSKYTKDYFKVQKGIGSFIFQIESLPLISGTYLVNLRVDINGEESDFPSTPVLKLRVVDGDFFDSGVVPLQHSPILIKGKWEHKDG